MEAADIFEETPQFLHVRDAPSSNLMAEVFSNQYLQSRVRLLAGYLSHEDFGGCASNGWAGR